MRTSAVTLIVLLTGCWKLDDETIGYDVVPLENQHVVGEDLVVQSFVPTPPLECPDGEPASFYAVYDQRITSPAPVAILFHSGAFDYVKNPAQDDFLAGTHYAPEDRLSASWAQTRVFSMLGMWEETVDPSEDHTGALVTALAQDQKLVLLPANCWGDLWHNYTGRNGNDYSTERFNRDGLALASWMYRIVTDASFAADHDAALPVPVDPEELALIGLGDGGRAVAELLWLLTDVSYADVEIPAVMVDSSPDDLGWYVEQPSQFFDLLTGLGRIYDGETDDLGAWSLEAYLADGAHPTPRTMMIWSEHDPEIPTGVMEGLAAQLAAVEDVDDSQALVEEIGASAHVFSNKDFPLAFDVVEFLFD
jgi:hypothetical protein